MRRRHAWLTIGKSGWLKYPGVMGLAEVLIRIDLLAVPGFGGVAVYPVLACKWKS